MSADRPRYPDGSIVMDEHVTAAEIARLTAALEAMTRERDDIRATLSDAEAECQSRHESENTAKNHQRGAEAKLAKAREALSQARGAFRGASLALGGSTALESEADRITAALQETAP